MQYSWQPTATIETLRSRATLLADIRAFFYVKNVFEVEVPILIGDAVSDPFIESLSVDNRLPGDSLNKKTFLNTSPEYAMKRLLCAGSGAIYSLGKVFRAGDVGRKHNPEFTMLEWYQPGYDMHQLMDEVAELVQSFLTAKSISRYTYREVFQQSLQIDPHTASLTELKNRVCQSIELNEVGLSKEPREFWLDLLMSHIIEPQLGVTIGCGPTFIYDYPICQSALAKIEEDDQGQPVAKRFELYYQGVELANGYDELLDADELRQRFEQDNKKRRQLALPVHEIDKKFLMAMDAGLPNCAGVALGVDRLLMLLLNKKEISEVISFSNDRI